MKFIASVIWKSKWLIAAATALAAAMAFALITPGKVEIWSGRAILTTGSAAASEFLLAQQSGPAVSPIETPRRTIVRLSNPTFRDQIIKQAAFEPATASISRSMVASSLRGIALDERRVAIELSAGSTADVQSAFRAIAAEIGVAHGAILDRQIQILQNRIEADKRRIAFIEKRIDELNDRVSKTMPPPQENEHRSSSVPPMLTIWNELQALLRDDMMVKQLSEPSVLHIETDKLVMTHRSIERLRASLLAGAGMLVAMIVLTIFVNPPKRANGGLGRIDLAER
ncbi:hypothetical protein [Bradyrhizobium sp. AZCC 2262]|uniref:hypothetical protein n=1 Tax=Bradyrhizobium sp. AZCC 2262 TaxID=3117022 RepID=UPI002FEFE56B